MKKEYTATAIYVVDEALSEVLLAIKAKKIAVGKYFPYGGKREGGESSLECAYRELKQETRGAIVARPGELVFVGQVCFYNGDAVIPYQCEPSFVVDFYILSRSKASLPTVPDTDEMYGAAWFGFDALPENMKKGDELFTRSILRGQPVIGYIHFSDAGEILHSTITECSIEVFY
jgi:ADP-ribose pyrophosphatase YjhB (NUDIX family)